MRSSLRRLQLVRRDQNLFVDEYSREELFGFADCVIRFEQAENFRVVKFEFGRDFELVANLLRGRGHERRD